MSGGELSPPALRKKKPCVHVTLFALYAKALCLNAPFAGLEATGIDAYSAYCWQEHLVCRICGAVRSKHTCMQSYTLEMVTFEICRGGAITIVGKYFSS